MTIIVFKTVIKCLLWPFRFIYFFFLLILAGTPGRRRRRRGVTDLLMRVHTFSPTSTPEPTKLSKVNFVWLSKSIFVTLSMNTPENLWTTVSVKFLANTSIERLNAGSGFFTATVIKSSMTCLTVASVRYGPVAEDVDKDHGETHNPNAAKTITAATNANIAVSTGVTSFTVAAAAVRARRNNVTDNTAAERKLDHRRGGCTGVVGGRRAICV